MVGEFKKAIRREIRRKDVGNTTKLCYQRILNDLSNKAWKFDPKDALSRIYFIENSLKHTGLEMGGKLLKLAFFQKFLLMSAYGFYNNNGTWRFRRVFLTTGRQNGKSTFIAAWQISAIIQYKNHNMKPMSCLLYTSPSPRDRQKSRMPSSA